MIIIPNSTFSNPLFAYDLIIKLCQKLHEKMKKGFETTENTEKYSVYSVDFFLLYLLSA
jgi:hypothetical protein